MKHWKPKLLEKGRSTQESIIQGVCTTFTFQSRYFVYYCIIRLFIAFTSTVALSLWGILDFIDTITVFRYKYIHSVSFEKHLHTCSFYCIALNKGPSITTWLFKPNKVWNIFSVLCRHHIKCFIRNICKLKMKGVLFWGLLGAFCNRIKYFGFVLAECHTARILSDQRQDVIFIFNLNYFLHYSQKYNLEKCLLAIGNRKCTNLL